MRASCWPPCPLADRFDVRNLLSRAYNPPAPERCWSNVEEEDQAELDRERYGDLEAAERGTTREEGAKEGPSFSLPPQFSCGGASRT